MNTSEKSLGGLLPLLGKEALDPQQKALYERMQKTSVPWAEASGFKAATPEGHLLGPFNAFLYNPAIGEAHLDLLKAENESTTLTKRQREIVILTVGAVWKSAYELYAHCAVAAKVGIGADEVEAIATGAVPEGLPPDEMLVHRFTQEIATKHFVDRPLYEQAIETLGHRGVIDLLHLAGAYMGVAAILNVFAVPTPE